jgi:hypothetical protein
MLKNIGIRWVTLIIVIHTIIISGCSIPERWSWTEQVLLSNGNIITLDRTAHRNNVWPRLGGGGYRAVVDQSFLCKTGGATNILWRQGNVPYKISPLSFDRIGNRIYLVGTPNASLLSECLLNPRNYNIVIFASTGLEGWALVPQSDLLLDSLHANMLWDVTWGDSTVAEKPSQLMLKDKSARANNYDFQAPMTVRNFLIKNGYACADILENAGYRSEAQEARSLSK